MNGKKTSGLGATLASMTGNFGKNLDKVMEDGGPGVGRILTGPGQLATFALEKQELLAQLDAKEQAAQALASRVGELEAKLADASSALSTEQIAELNRQLEAQRALHQEAEDALRNELEDIQAALAQTAEQSAFPLPINKIVRVPGRQRSKPPEEYAKMKRNIARHGIGSPVVVRRLPDGNYELIAGYNRLQIWEELGNTIILATLQTLEDQKAKELAFFDNFLVAELPHFQKYLGLINLQKDHYPDLQTIRALAAYTGESEPRISELMVYGKLPHEVTELLMRCEHALNVDAALELLKLVKQGRKEQVISAVRAAVDSKGTMPQGEIVSRASQVGVVAPDATEPVWFKAGERNVFSLKVRKNSFSIKLEPNVNKSKVEAAIRAALEQVAADLPTG